MKQSSCVYLIDRDHWLFLLRNKKSNDVNQDKFIGVGGKKDADETIEQCARREVKEETGLIVSDLCDRGILIFHYPHLEDEVITIFTCNSFSGKMLKCDEGDLVWVKESDIMHLNLWEGDRIFLRKLIAQEAQHFRIELYYNAYDELIKFTEESI